MSVPENNFLDRFHPRDGMRKWCEQKQRGASRTRKGSVDRTTSFIRALSGDDIVFVATSLVSRPDATQECQEIEVIRVNLIRPYVSPLNRSESDYVRLRSRRARDFAVPEGGARSQQGQLVRSMRKKHAGKRPPCDLRANCGISGARKKLAGRAPRHR